MTITEESTTTGAGFELVAFDLYRDIHKGIRSELFAVTTSAGQTDPGDDAAVCALATHVRDVHALLESHAEHEDVVIQPLVEVHLPRIAEQVAVDHLTFERRTESLVALAADTAGAAAGDRRRMAHLLYVDLASFAGAYLAHQDLEERVLMPALQAAVGFEAVLGMHQQIVGSIPPDEMARSLAFMLPAMNVDDRADMLGGMRASAPAEVFDGVWGLAGSVLEPADLTALARRLGV